jgi:hypothetical protein
MDYQKLLKNSVVDRLKKDLSAEGGIDTYLNSGIQITDNDLLVNQKLLVSVPKLYTPKDREDFEFQNAVLVYEAYKMMSPVEATDVRLWTYLTHVTFWDYMKVRRPIQNQPSDKRKEYILEHWFVDKINTAKLLRNDISLLWWVTYLTYDEHRKDPYELTREVFTMLDYTRHLLPGTQGRNKKFVQALLEYVVENKPLFSSYKESKVRFLMRQTNYIAGYRVLPTLSKDETKQALNQYHSQLSNIIS